MAANATATVDERAEALREWLSEQLVGTASPEAVKVQRAVDSEDRAAWYFEIVLANPAAEVDTWSVDDLNELQLRARDRALELGLDWPWYLRFRPVDDEPPEEPAVEIPA